MLQTLIFKIEPNFLNISLNQTEQKYFEIYIETRKPQKFSLSKIMFYF